MATLVTDKGAPYIEDIWTIDDFYRVAKDEFEDEEFSEEEVLEAMELVEINFDANLGINWETLVAALHVVLYNQKERERDNQ